MTRMQFENKITVGNLLTLGAVLIAAISGYNSLQSEQNRQSDRMTAIEETFKDRIAIADANRTATDARLRSLEVAQASQSSDLRNIQAGINDIKGSLAALSQKVTK